MTLGSPAVGSTVLALVIAFAGTSSGAPSVEWNQDRVTELAVELSAAVHNLHRSFRREPRPPFGSGQARARHQFADTLRVLRTEARALASQLESGAGFEETFPIARRSGVLIRDLRQEGRRMHWGEPLLGLVQRVDELIGQIAPFYFDAAAVPAE